MTLEQFIGKLYELGLVGDRIVVANHSEKMLYDGMLGLLKSNREFHSFMKSRIETVRMNSINNGFNYVVIVVLAN